MKCPCNNCITLPACKHEALNILVSKCSILNEYLKITKVTSKKYETGTTITTTTKLSSNLGTLLHKYRIGKINQVIPHTFKMS